MAGNVVSNYAEQRSESENEFYHHFLYTTDLEIGQLVAFALDGSDDPIDETVSPYTDDADGGTTAIAFEDAIGVCMQRKVFAWNNRNKDDLVDVRLFGSFRTVGTCTVTGDGVVAGDLLTYKTGKKMLITTGAATGNTAKFIGE